MGRTKLQAKVEPAPKRWLNKQEAMAYLGVGEDYLSKLRNEAKVSLHILRNNGIHLSKTGSLILDFPVYPFSMLHIYE